MPNAAPHQAAAAALPARCCAFSSGFDVMPQMPSRRKALVFVVTTLAALAAGAASAQTPADFFNDNSLKEVRLRVNRLDWATLKAHPERNTYYPADVAW